MKKLPSYILILIVSLAAGTANAGEMTLDQFLSRVKQHSRELKLAEQEVQYAGAEKKSAMSYALPRVSAEADYTRYLSDAYMYMDLASLGGDEGDVQKIRTNRDNNYSLNVTLVQTLFSGGVINGIRAAGQYRRMTDFIYRATYQEIMTVSRQAFYRTILLDDIRQVAQNSQQNAYDNYMNMQSRYENGQVSQFELLQAEVRYRESIPQSTEAGRNYEISLVNLKNLAGIPIDSSLTLAGNLDSYPELPAELTLDSVLNTRPDFQALRWEEKLRQTGVRAELSNYLPTLAGFVSYNYSAQSDQWSLDEENNVWLLGLKLSLPIFEGGERFAQVRKSRIDLRKTRLRIERTGDNIARDIRSIRLQLEEAYQRIESAQATRDASEKAFAIAEVTARNGLTTQLQLKDSRVALDQATVGYYSAVYEYLAANFEWEKVTGKAQ